MAKARRKRSKGGREIVARTTPRGWEVRWHPDALAERDAAHPGAERVAIAHVIEKLQVDGPALRSPHQSAVMGEEGRGSGSCVPDAAEAAGGRSTEGSMSGYS